MKNKRGKLEWINQDRETNDIKSANNIIAEEEKIVLYDTRCKEPQNARYCG
jgi:hypothetical protein